MSPLQPLPPTFAATVTALHSVAEQIVAPARKPDNEIALEPAPGGFGTPPFVHEGRRQRVRVEGADLVRDDDGDERRTALTTLEDARRLVADLVPGGPLGAEPLDVDPVAAARLADWYAFGADILGAIADATATPARLWPEHFDLAIEMGTERANYGFSPGDENHAEPYAYVGPWTAEVAGELWQATGFRGAELAYAELLAAADPSAAALDFFLSRKEALA
ncbi:MAG TPA: hypothetical protein VFM58_01370 [Solirubrobacteraceae bacterium]|jgi:hypothetical protein|nr:hypothetical protein [Solirubrobacteraceae bacterium]